MIFSVCTDDSHVWDTTDKVCVCAVDYYQTADGDPPTCTPCPSGSTTNGEPNSDACGKYDKNIPISRY